jgi:hypothetical protein
VIDVVLEADGALLKRPVIEIAALVRKPLADIGRPPKVNPSTARDRGSPDQISFCHA